MLQLLREWIQHEPRTGDLFADVVHEQLLAHEHSLPSLVQREASEFVAQWMQTRDKAHASPGSGLLTRALLLKTMHSGMSVLASLVDEVCRRTQRNAHALQMPLY